jgi:4-amino-4-deoxy-L-arabinose transferase-like glycosyltransferase
MGALQPVTDALVAACVAAACFCLLQDLRLERAPAFYGFSLSTAAAILTKSVAGLIPIFILLAVYALARWEDRPSLRRGGQACALVAAISLPWFIYQAVAHTRWFWGEHIGLEILTFGLGRPPQTSP